MTTFKRLVQTLALFSAWQRFPCSASSPSPGISVIHPDGHVTSLKVDWNEFDLYLGDNILYANATIRTTPVFGSHGNQRSDYVDTGIKLKPNPKSQSTPAVAEISIICDMDFSAIFNNDPQRIKKYWQAFFWDINTRFQSLPNSPISFRITSIVYFQEAKHQPFIEEARQPDGTVNFQIVLDVFSKWVYKAKKELPEFDIAMVFTAAKTTDNIIGIAYLNGACGLDDKSQRYIGTAVGIDRGDFRVLLAAHELGHVLGAPHDAEIDGCSDRSFIMSDASAETQYFFSSCSDKAIKQFVDSTNADCLRKNESPKEVPIINDATPSLQDQCKLIYVDGSIAKNDLEKCSKVNCTSESAESEEMWPVDYTPCAADDSKRCFRGRCIEPGFSLKNKATEKCIVAGNTFSAHDKLVVSDCPKPGDYSTPLQRFSKQSTSSLENSTDTDQGPYYIKAPYSLADGSEQGDKCMGTEDGSSVSLEKCPETSAAKWEWKLIPNSQEGDYVLLQHNSSLACLGIEDNKVVINMACDKDKAEFSWKII